MNEHQQIIEKQNSQMPQAMRDVMNPTNPLQPFKLPGMEVTLEYDSIYHRQWYVRKAGSSSRVIVWYDLETGWYNYQTEGEAAGQVGTSKSANGVISFCKRVLGG